MKAIAQLVLLCAATSACSPSQAAGDPIFYDDVSDGSISDWTLSSSLAAVDNSSGNYSISFRGTATAAHNVATTGMSRVTATLMLAASSLESSDTCNADISVNGGSTWTTIFTIGDGQDDKAYRVAVAAPAGISNNALVMVRFRAATGATGDYCYGDNVQFSGNDGYDTEGFATLPGSGVTGRNQLTYPTLMTGTGNGSRLDMGAFAVPQGAAEPTYTFQGRLTLINTATNGGFAEILDSYSYTGLADATRKHLPTFDFDFVQSGSHLIPSLRQSIASSHPEWEFLLMPGRVWKETSDNGYSRASIPFALQQKNANCTHNGVLTFLFKDGGLVSKVAYQIGSETCAYYKVDMWGLLSATYTPATLANAAAIVSNYQQEVNTRLPTKPLEELLLDYPTMNPAKMSNPGSTDPMHNSLTGFLVAGTHYVGGCRTRWGLYPFCSNLVVPSYSGAKSAFAAMAMMRLENKYPGARAMTIAQFVPNCYSKGNWGDVTLNNVLDMATGNYAQAGYEVDESASHANGLFLALTHADKINYSCTYYSRKAPPGTLWVYHSSDTYVAGTMMNAMLKSLEGSSKDLFNDLLVGELFAPINVSQTARYSRRTYDTVAQPFTAYGLSWVRDDVAKIGQWIGVDDGVIAGVPMLDSALLNSALQRDAGDRGLVPLTDYRYNNGFWALNIKANLACAHDVYVPFMSGYGGISVLLLPNDTVFYLFSDNSTYFWMDAALEANKVSSLCL